MYTITVEKESAGIYKWSVLKGGSIAKTGPDLDSLENCIALGIEFIPDFEVVAISYKGVLVGSRSASRLRRNPRKASDWAESCFIDALEA